MILNSFFFIYCICWSFVCPLLRNIYSVFKLSFLAIEFRLNAIFVTVSLQYSLKSGNMVPRTSFFLKSVLSIQYFFVVPLHFMILFLFLWKNVRILTWFILNLYITLGSVDTLKILFQLMKIEYFLSVGSSFSSIFYSF